MVFGGFRIAGALSDAHRLRLAADRAEMVPAITKYMSALDVALLASSTGGDADGAKKNYDARKSELEARLHGTDVAPDVSAGVDAMLDGGQSLLDNVASNTLGLRPRVTTYAPILLTAENAIDGSVRVDNEQIRAEAQGLSRAIGARGQMMMQQVLIARGADLPEPELRTSMITLAGTEPSTLFGMAEVLGVGSPEAKTLQQQMVTRMGADVRSGAKAGQQPGAAALGADHRRDRRADHQGHHREGDQGRRGPGPRPSQRRDPGHRAGAGRHRRRTASSCCWSRAR